MTRPSMTLSYRVSLQPAVTQRFMDSRGELSRATTPTRSSISPTSNADVRRRGAARCRARRRGPTRASSSFAHASLPRTLPLLHVRAVAPRKCVVPVSLDRAYLAIARAAPRRVAIRRSSRSATSLSSVTASPAKGSQAGARDDVSYADEALAPFSRKRTPPSHPWCSPTRIAALRKVSVSQGLMLDSASERLCRSRRPALRIAGKKPTARLETLGCRKGRAITPRAPTASANARRAH